MGHYKTDHRTDPHTDPHKNDVDLSGRLSGTVLVVAGLDPSGGAGLLADARHVAFHGFHCAGVATALTEQDSAECAAMYATPAALVGVQLQRLVGDLGPAIRAVKVGMLANADVLVAVATALRPLAANVPIVVDPVLRATKGVALFVGDISGYASLLELATLVTPNLAELAMCTGSSEARNPEEMLAQAQRLRDQRLHGHPAVLAKGGHLPGDPVDILVTTDGGVTRFSGPRTSGPSPHGTGCALSTDIACRLATGASLVDAVSASVDRLRHLIAAARPVGRGRPFL